MLPIVRAAVSRDRRRNTGYLAGFVAIVLHASFALAFQAVEKPGGKVGGNETLSAAQTAFFETKIRPILVEKCYSCHSSEAKKQAGVLLLDSRDALIEGGDSGPAIVPGDPTRSPLILAIRYSNPDFAMPPKDKGGKLPDSVIRDFEQWIRGGAPDPRVADSAENWSESRDKEAMQWWAFQPIRKPSIPTPSDSHWSKTDIDKFVGSTHQQHGLAPVGFADPAVLVRRLYYDLLGLPPQPKDTETFVQEYKNASNPNLVVAKTVDTLLDSPQFGTHWGRHWLDVARYAESSGKDVNIAFPHAWRYRDYVIDAFNADMPFDQFIREQIAGDLLAADDDAAEARQIIATGFLAIGAKSINEINPQQLAVDVADEQLDATFQAFTGLTAGCARCHDHKFDPISQEDYTALAGIFLSTETYYGTAGGVQGRNKGKLIELPENAELKAVRQSMSSTQYQRQQQRLSELKIELQDIAAERARSRRSGQSTSQQGNTDVLRITTQISQLEALLMNYSEQGQVLPLAMGASDKPISVNNSFGIGNRFAMTPGGRRRSGFETLVDSPLFARGDITLAGKTVRRGVLPLFDESDEKSLQLISSKRFTVPRGTSGRLQLADWIASRNNPLTARVITNRVWYWLMGRGLVSSLDNFGTTGDQPSNPELLDYLSSQLMASDWRIKPLIRSIVLTHTYQLASSYNEENYVIDPENKFQWRHSPRRLNAEEIRDSILNAAGTLDLSPQTGSMIGAFGDGQIGGNRNGLSEQSILSAGGNARSIYMPCCRNLQPEVLSVFDFPDGSAVQGEREATNVPAQALFCLNNPMVAESAANLADRLLKAFPGRKLVDYDARSDLAYHILFSRSPSPNERLAARKLLMLDNSGSVAAWTSVARALMASAEFRYLD